MSTITAHHAIASVPSCQVRTSHIPAAYASKAAGIEPARAPRRRECAAYDASALDLSWLNSASEIAPRSRSSLPLAISSVAEPDEATERT
jgi:hypothetical protein